MTSTGEMIDIFDAGLNHLGEMERKASRTVDVWSKSAHCWILNPEDGGKILLQKRAPHLYLFPNTYCSTAGGAYSAGETEKDAVREIEEELNITVSFDELINLGLHTSAMKLGENEFSKVYTDVFFLEKSTPIQDYTPDEGEVFGLFEISIQDGLNIFTDPQKHASISGIHYSPQDQSWHADTRQICAADFFPQMDAYYLKVMIMAERYFNKQFPIAI